MKSDSGRRRRIILILAGVFALGIAGLDYLFVWQKQFMCRARQGEARANLRALWTLEQGFHSGSGRYSASLKEIAFFPEPNRRYAYGFAAAGEEDALPADNRTKPGHISDLPATTGASKEHFRAAAAGIPWTWGDVLDVWVVDETGNLSNVVDGCRWSIFRWFAPG
jgi:hypothetical protein